MLRTLSLAGLALAFALAVALAGSSCGGASSGVDPFPPGGTRVLFVGNSLTYVNDLPETLAGLAAGVGDTIRVASVALPNFALIDHVNGGSGALAEIGRRDWDYVVLQQGPTRLGICADTLVLAAQRFDAPIRAAGAVPTLLMTWPTISDFADMDLVRQSYQRAAAAVGGLFAPAGEAWRLALAADPGVALYGGDGFHPAPLGTYLTALVLYERITGRDARDQPPTAIVNGQPVAVSEATVRLLQGAAHEANVALPAYPAAQPAPGSGVMQPRAPVVGGQPALTC